MSRFVQRFHLMCAIVASLTSVSCLVLAIVFLASRVKPAAPLGLAIIAAIIGAGAVMEFKFYKDERDGKTDVALHDSELQTTSQDQTTNGQLVLVTTRLRALIAVALTLWFLYQRFHTLASARPHSFEWLYSGLLPHWAIVPINLAFYGFLIWIGVNFALASLRNDEKVLLVAFWIHGGISPVSALLPGTFVAMWFIRTLLELAAFLASLSILLSFGKKKEDGANPPTPENSQARC